MARHAPAATRLVNRHDHEMPYRLRVNVLRGAIR
jgi:hypothetical protein